MAVRKQERSLVWYSVVCTALCELSSHPGWGSSDRGCRHERRGRPSFGNPSGISASESACGTTRHVWPLAWARSCDCELGALSASPLHGWLYPRVLRAYRTESFGCSFCPPVLPLRAFETIAPVLCPVLRTDNVFYVHSCPSHTATH